MLDYKKSADDMMTLIKKVESEIGPRLPASEEEKKAAEEAAMRADACWNAWWHSKRVCDITTPLGSCAIRSRASDTRRRVSRTPADSAPSSVSPVSPFLESLESLESFGGRRAKSSRMKRTPQRGSLQSGPASQASLNPFTKLMWNWRSRVWVSATPSSQPSSSSSSSFG